MCAWVTCDMSQVQYVYWERLEDAEQRLIVAKNVGKAKGADPAD